jgi:uncharacterized membrane-anchored protein
MRRKPDALNARCLAGVLLLALACAPLRAEDAAAEPTAQPTAEAAAPDAGAVTPAEAQLLTGPLSVSLPGGADLELPEGWRWVAKEQLRAYLLPTGRKPGAWDAGIALPPGEGAKEFHLQFEPMGLVEAGDAAALAPDALLARLQELAKAANQRRRLRGQPEQAVSGWALPPTLELDGQRLVWAERSSVGADERLGWHGRLRLRGGVIKLDLGLAPDDWAILDPEARALFSALAPKLGQAVVSRQSVDKVAAMDLPELVVDGVFGRGALAAGPAEAEDAGLWARLAAWAAAAAALVAAGLWAWRRVQALKLQRMKERLDEARLAQLEKDLGGRAEDVEEIVDDEEQTPV